MKSKCQKSKIFEHFRNKRFRKKAQMEMAENIGILIIFFFLLIFGMVFYFKIQKVGFESRKEEFDALEAIKTAQKISFLPELKCSQDNIEKDNCFSLYKMNAFVTFLESNPDIRDTYYYDILGSSKIYINQIFPKSDNSWIIYDRSLQNFTNKFSSPVPIFLYNSTTDEQYFGVMYIEVYQ